VSAAGAGAATSAIAPARLVVDVLASKAGGRTMESDAGQLENDILSASIAHILKNGKDKDALTKFIVGTFSTSENDAASLAERALSIHGLVVGVTASLAKGAPADVVTKRLEDAGMSHDSAESIVVAASTALAEARSKSWKTELRVALLCMAIGLVFTALVKNVIFMAFCVVGGYYAARSAWHVTRQMKAPR
jgi:hypothetical protein